MDLDSNVPVVKQHEVKPSSSKDGLPPPPPPDQSKLNTMPCSNSLESIVRARLPEQKDTKRAEMPIREKPKGVKKEKPKDPKKEKPKDTNKEELKHNPKDTTKKKSSGLMAHPSPPNKKAGKDEGTPIEPEATDPSLDDNTKKKTTDLDEVKLFRQRKDIFVNSLGNINNYNMLDYVVQMMNEKKLNIVTVRALKDELRPKKDTQSKSRLSYLRMQTKLILCCGSNVKPEFLVDTFVMPGTKKKIMAGALDNFSRQSMIGLYGLHNYEVIAKISTTKTGDISVKALITEGYCCYCSFTNGNHLTLNDHICMHERLALICHLDGCFTIEVKAEKIKTHGKVHHSITWGKACAKGGEMDMESLD